MNMKLRLLAGVVAVLAGCSTPPKGVTADELLIQQADGGAVAATIKKDMNARGYLVEAESPGMLSLTKISAAKGFMAGLVPSSAGARLVTVFTFQPEGTGTMVRWSSEWRIHMPDGKDSISATQNPAAITDHLRRLQLGLEKPAG